MEYKIKEIKMPDPKDPNLRMQEVVTECILKINEIVKELNKWKYQKLV